MGSALLDTTPGSAADSSAANAEAAARMPAGDGLRQQAAERLAAHRSKRAGMKPARDSVQQATTSGNARAAQIAAAVAERYAKSQSYRAFLAAEAERAVQQARAAAEVAAIKAEAMEAAQQSLLDALESEAAGEPSASVPDAMIAEAIRTPEAPMMTDELSFWPEAVVHERPAARHAPRTHRPPPVAHPELTPPPVAPFAVRVQDDVVLPAWHREALRENRFFEREESEGLALDEEIEFRQAPVFEEFRSRPEPLPANLIEFPRQLVASRKARPRLAEGPLREDGSEPSENQLRIFEVDTAQISTEPAVDDAQAAQWTSIFLDLPQRGQAAVSEEATAAASAASLPGAASVARRAAAAAINGSIIGMAVAAFGAAAMITSGNAGLLQSLSVGSAVGVLVGELRTPDGRGLLGAGAVVALLLCLAYQALFFTFSTATPGMRCVRIGLCTFGDENPTRKAMRRRIVAVVLSAVPFGLGFIWAALDEERLSWHDRVSGMYQRGY
jgi:uncharacterized RDD family membrane protein YckC